jgi:hypothetical protein
MKKYIYIIFIGILILVTSCSSDDNIETVSMRVNHYKQTANGLFPKLVYLIQEENEIGTTNWNYFYSNIEGFEYELGFTYDILVIKESIDNPPQDASSIKYTLKNVISKEKVGDDITFEIRLKSVTRNNPPSYVTGNLSSGYKILNTTEIDCGELCENLSENLENEDEVSGLFKHIENGKLKLIELIIE